MDFAEFFKAVHDGLEPFPWQQQLADRLATEGTWPAVIDLPTASGKTAVLDIAVWHLAQQAKLPPQERTAPRRIWFVVDRRIVVDEAYRRAADIAHWLTKNRTSDVAKALYEVSGLGSQSQSGDAPPLSYGRLRGGILQDTGWASFPSQPAILTSTVDQLGSRLLFRGYGMGSGMWPVHAALAGNDSLLVLDEAHLAEPLMQTLRWVRHYRDDASQQGAPPHDGPRWCEQKIELPWQMTVMSATPPPGEADRFPGSRQAKAAALNHLLLKERIDASKKASLIQVNGPKGKKRPATACANGAAEQALRFKNAGRQRTAVMMNRVDAAVAVHEALSRHDDTDTILLTGRMRPFDRDRLLKEWLPTLKSGSIKTPAKPIILITTQCLEVGADLSFDALVTECASMDALRQRFGRLDRLGKLGQTEAVILAWHGDVDGSRSDPIYGEALRKTWDWLNEASDSGVIDLGIAAMDAMLDDVDEKLLQEMLPPRPDAPVLLPAYLDAWCQTGPRPHVEAAPSLFLHGKNTNEQADVQIAFRDDLAGKFRPRFAAELSDDQCAQIVRLMPPVSGELLTVRLHRLRQWLQGDPVAADSDVEGALMQDDDGELKPADDPRPKRWVRYAGQGSQTRVLTKPHEICPGDVLVFPAGEQIPRALGHGEMPGQVDIHEQAIAKSGRPQMFRLTPHLLEQWSSEHPSCNTDELRAWLNTEDQALPDRHDWSAMQKTLCHLVPESLRQAVEALQGDKFQDAQQDQRAESLRKAVKVLQSSVNVVHYPGHPQGVVLIGPRRDHVDDAQNEARDDDRTTGRTRRDHVDHAQNEADPFADEGDSRSLIGQPVSLDGHHQQVAKLVRISAQCCIPDFANVLVLAAELHDAGKDEPRFQALLHKQSYPWHGDKPLAKSGHGSSPADHQLRHMLGIVGFRHEMLSMQHAAKKYGDDDLLLHLIASHHGHARPFAPVFVDDELWNDRPPHHLASGVAERFWKLTRRYGWWGLAYLEAVLRLADHHASRFPQTNQTEADDD